MRPLTISQAFSNPTSSAPSCGKKKRNGLRGIKWDIDNRFVTRICRHLFDELREDVPAEARTRCVLPCYIELVTPREIRAIGPDDFRRQLVIVLGARESERDRKVTTTDERTSTETLVDCYNGLIELKDEKTRKAVSLDIGAIPMMVLPESAIRTPVFDDEMVAGNMVKPEGAVERAVATHEQCRLSMKSLLGDNVSPKLLQKLEEAPDEHTLRYHHPLLHNTY
ncbi:uncharacterized protein TRAVEDRAFT_54422 [Trametes versicolor FP-101664 SS1]|uniref:Uncharacterized protein n=1 Tax=Trametes versicolor (strain FP-101664) TaxID=717944 RepID=R7S9Q8_TRAVS|nr:uncharacterized protein TRAVEDRAFT_54422 [Trametes versicolor FP-101664 SS1]EIW51669.1 hypothetical protein TRAVEDRAFT_54422 [Trametes versicolor FP-101664 SS1]